jgi:hypothetical protein
MKESEESSILRSHSVIPTGVCPISQKRGKIGSRGCGFAFLMQAFPTSNSEGSCPMSRTSAQALTDVLMPDHPSKNKTCDLENVDDLNPTDEEVLSAVFDGLGAPTRAILARAELTGPRTGWRDGHLSSSHGFCPPDPSASANALAQSPGFLFFFCLYPNCLGRVWSELCDRLADVVSRGEARESILNLPTVDLDAIPDDALWAAVVCLGILAHTYRYEEKYSGHEGNFQLVFWLTCWGHADDTSSEANH